MANGQNGQTGQQNLSTLPYPGAPSDAEWLKGAGVGTTPGTSTAVQPPPAQPGFPTSPSGWANRYATAAGEGAAFNAPLAGAEAVWGPPGWGAAATTLGLGALGGVESQGAQDIYKGVTGEDAPWWLGPTAATVGTLGLGSVSQWGPAALRAAKAYGPTVGFGGVLLHDVFPDLAHTVLDHASHIVGAIGPETAGALAIGAGALKTAGRILRGPGNFRNWKMPITAAVGGSAPGVVNALSPSDYNTP